MSTPTTITPEAVAKLLPLLRSVADQVKVIADGRGWRDALELALEVSEAHRAKPDGEAIVAIIDQLQTRLEPLTRFSSLLDVLTTRLPLLADPQRRMSLFNRLDGPMMLVALTTKLQSEIRGLRAARLPLLRVLADRCIERGTECCEVGKILGDDSSDPARYYFRGFASRDAGYDVGNGARIDYCDFEVDEAEMRELCELLDETFPLSLEERDEDEIQRLTIEELILATTDCITD